MTATNPSTTDIEIAQVETRFAAVVRKRVAFAEMATAERDARRALDAALSTMSDRTRRSLTIWHPPRDGQIDYAPGEFVTEAFDAAGDVSLYTLPAGRAARLRLRGPYDQLPGAWQRLFEGCSAQGLRTAGVNWQVYTTADATAEKIETDLYALLA